MKKTSIEDLHLKGKKVFLRVDYNVPLDDNLNVTDNTRIKASLPTLKFLMSKGARIVLFSHLGRPKGKIVENLSLKPVATELGKLIKKEVGFSQSLIGSIAQTSIDCIEDGECLLMENVRFFPEEEANDKEFSKELASMFDLYVNDAFGTVHRAHASTEGVARHFKNAACGYLIQKELDYLGSALDKPERPFTAILGGAKVKDKIQVITELLNKADNILIGGGMAYTFLKIQGKDIGDSMFDEESAQLAETILSKALNLNKKIYLPKDHVAASEFSNDSKPENFKGDIPAGYMGLDIGAETVEEYSSIIHASKTVIWNGPMGVFEFSNFSNGTFSIAKEMSEADAITIIGGGDSAAAVNKIKLGSKMTHVSTGGGASLEFLEGKALPGIEALSDKENWQ